MSQIVLSQSLSEMCSQNPLICIDIINSLSMIKLISNRQLVKVECSNCIKVTVPNSASVKEIKEEYMRIMNIPDISVKVTSSKCYTLIFNLLHIL